MALWVIELDDTEVRVTRDGELVDASPGVALVGTQTVITGEEARARRYLDPRAARDRFWQQLNQLPLPDTTRQCRHHADLAYHHLDAILNRCGRPTEAVLAVPAHYGPDELALLLGIAGALGLGVADLVDSGVAALAGSAPPGHYVVAELFQHHATLTEIDVGDSVKRKDVEIVEPATRDRLEKGLADLIADAFLDQARFDPLHDAASEQRLHDALPAWITRAATTAGAVELTLDYRGQRFTAQVAVREIERVTSMVLAPLAERVDPDRSLVLAARLGELPGAVKLLAPAAVLPSAAPARGIAEHRLAFGSPRQGAAFIVQLPAARVAAFTNPTQTDNPESAVTHLLCGVRAVALGATPLALEASGALTASAQPDSATVVVLAGKAILDPGAQAVAVNQEKTTTRVELNAGDRISLGAGHASFLAINVS
ncbi:MAG: hypothetical protein WD928_03830 [Gammaproteobacteria bacterium]